MKLGIILGLVMWLGLFAAWHTLAEGKKEGTITVMVLATINVWDGTVAQLAYVPAARQCMLSIVTPDGATHFKPTMCPGDPHDFFGLQGKEPMQKQKHKPREWSV